MGAEEQSGRTLVFSLPGLAGQSKLDDHKCGTDESGRIPVEFARTATARRLSRATSAHSEDKRVRDDRRRSGSCRRARRPGALRKLSARETTGGHTEAVVARKAALGPARSETSGASYRTSGDQRGTSGDQRGARPVARAAGRARSQRFRATSARRSESVIRGGARGTSARGES